MLVSGPWASTCVTAHMIHHGTSVVPPALPEPPEEPQVLSQSSHSVTLSWHKPPGDVLGYKVERKIPGVGWQSCSEGLIQSTEFTVDGLAPGEPYRFRVSAINKAGSGEVVHFPQMVRLGEDGHRLQRGLQAPAEPTFCMACLLHPLQASPSVVSFSAWLPTQ